MSLFSIRRLPFLLLAAGAAAPLSAQYLSLDYALYNFYAGTRDFNLVTWGDFNRPSSGQDTEGGVLIGGRINLNSNFVFHGNPGTATKGFGSDPDVIAYGGITITNSSNFQMVNNSAVAAINLAATNPVPTWNANDKRLIVGSAQAGLPWNTQSPQAVFDTWSASAVPMNVLQSRLNLASVSLKGFANQNVVAGNQSNQLSLTVSANSVGIWNVDHSQIANLNEINLNVPTNSALVINVHGSAGGTFPTNANAIGGTTAAGSRILWNFLSTAQSSTQAQEAAASMFTYTMGNGGGAVWGSVLAPKANLTANKVIEGQVVANSFTLGSVELHQEFFIPQMSFTQLPEPSTVVALAGVAALATAFGFRRRKS